MRNTPNLTHAQELVSLRTGRDLGELLEDMYVVRRQSQSAIAAELGVARLTVAMWLLQFGIRRDREEATA